MAELSISTGILEYLGGAMSSFWIIFESSLFAAYSQGKLQIMEHNPS
jgi:hypothetical protein